MSKKKKNRFYYSKKQSEIDEEMWNMPTRFTFVKTPDGWKQYSEWCSVKSAKCNWEDAKLVYETDDEPEVIIHECIPELIADLEAKLAESEKNVEFYQERYSNATTSAYGADLIAKNVQSRLEEEIRELKQQLAEKEKEIDEINKAWAQSVHDWKELCKNKDQDKIFFAVEKLKETKIYVDSQHFMSARYKCEKKVYADIWNFIDQQIKQLKEGK